MYFRAQHSHGGQELALTEVDDPTNWSDAPLLSPATSVRSSRLPALAVALLTAIGTASAAHAQSTPYYLLNGDAQTGYIVRDGAVQSTFSAPGSGPTALYPIRFDGAKFLLSQRDGGAAVEYNADGTPTGTTYTHPGQNVDQVLDGATDGTHTYAVRCCTGDANTDGLYRGDLNFGGLTLLSSTGISGVTFATSNGHLFTTDFEGMLSELSATGELLNSWNTDVSTPAALAYEASSNSLWFIGNGSPTIFNYSLAGERLQQINIAGLAGNNIYGGEMPGDTTPSTTTPEPSTWALLGAGLAAVAAAARRRPDARA